MIRTVISRLTAVGNDGKEIMSEHVSEVNGRCAINKLQVYKSKKAKV